jgi:hypothetical protein
METPIRISYKHKSLLYVDYASTRSKEEKLTLLKIAAEEYMKQPQNSVLAIINLTKVNYDIEIVNNFIKSREKTAPYEKKEAIIGMSSLQRVAYNFICGLKNNNTKTFDSEIEAKEWLVEE